MKKVLFILALCVMAGCSNKANKAQKAAEEFLDAFLQNDYKTATQLCSEQFGQEFEKSITDFENLNNPIKEMIKEHCAQLKYEIISVERINKSDTFNVNYNILKSLPDSSSLSDKQMFSSTLKVMGGEIIQLNK